MARKDEAIPVEHGFGSAAAITASETGKGFFRGIAGGGWRGALIGAVVVGGLMAAGASLVFGATGMAVIGGLGALFGGGLGLVPGAAVGAAVGPFQGVGKAADRISRDNAAAQLSRTQEMTAQAQTETAKALQGRIIERMSAPVPYPQPEPQVQTREYHGRGVAQVPHHATGGSHAQRVQQEQLAQSGEQQIG